MEKKLLFGTLGGAVAGIAVAMIFFMGIYAGMAEKWMAEHGACLKEMDMKWWFVASVIQGFFYALLLHKLGANTFRSGAITGAWITFLIALVMGISMASTYTAYPWSWLPYDLISQLVSGAVTGGVIGWIFSKVK
jgi:hypothetical protein